MEAALQSIVKVYLKSSKGKEYLGKKEFQSLVSSQFSNILTGADSKEAIDNMSKGLDSDQSGNVGFEEYMKLVEYLACSTSKQRMLEKDTPANSTASAQEPQSAAAGDDKQKAEPAAEVKTEAAAAVKVNAEPEAEVKAEGEAKPEAKVEVAAPAAATAPAAVTAAATAAAAVTAAAPEVEVKKANKAEEAAAAEKPAPVEKDVEKKPDEAAS